MHALMFTVDVPVGSKQERELRNRFGQPRLPLRLYLKALRHPVWLFDYFRHGMPVFENWTPYSENGSSVKSVLKSVGAQFPVADHTWRDVENFRRIRPRPFILKGILPPTMPFGPPSWVSTASSCPTMEPGSLMRRRRRWKCFLR